MDTLIERQKTIIHIPKEFLREDPPIPKSAKIELTSRCNYKCQYCAITTRNGKKPQDMDWGLFKKIAGELKRVGVQEIGLFYIGESFTNPELLIRAIQFLKTELEIPYVFLTSNASLASAPVVEACMKARLNSLKWSCNASDPEQFSSLMGVPAFNFEKAKENIKAAWELRAKFGYNIKLYASSVKYSGEQVEKMQPFLKEHILPYVDYHYWLPLYSGGGQVIAKERELGMQPIAGNPGRLDDPADPIPCWTLFTAAHILYDGRVTACCLDGTGNWVMGDLKYSSFPDVWSSQAFRELRRAHLKGDILGTKCEKCVMGE